MKAVDALRRNVPLVTVVGFVVACALGFAFLWVKGGGTIPGVVTEPEYRVSFTTPDLKNLRDGGHVEIAGVKVGEVVERHIDGDKARVVLSLTEEAAPLHEGATVRVSMKSLIGSSYVEIDDGDGEPLSSGTALPATSVRESIDIDELLSTFTPKTRESLRGAVRSLAQATHGTAADIDKVMSGLGNLGREGHTVLDALAAQSRDLQALSTEATTLLDTLDTGRGQIATLVQDAKLLTDATAGKRARLEETMRLLPGTLSNVRVAADKLSELSRPLSPIAADLRQAAPHLNSALVNLRPVTNDLRGLLPALDGTLDRAPATLERVPAFSADARALIPQARTLLRDVNPMLAYLQPYGRDLGAMFANFGATFETQEPNGIRPIRLAAILNPGSIRGNPVPLDALESQFWNNPYPAPGQAGDPAPYRGEYPRVERAPK